MTSFISTIDDFKKEDYKVDCALIPSGTFYYSPHVAQPIRGGLNELLGSEQSGVFISNPFPTPGFEIEHTREFIKQEENDLFDLVRNDSKKIIEVSEIASYTHMLKELAVDLSFAGDRIVICPLRGIYRTALHLYTMSVFDHVHWLNYTGGSTGKYDGRIKAELSKIIAEIHHGNSFFELSIVDTADSGHGINHLVPLLKEVKKLYPNDSWHVKLYILHDKEAQIGNIEKVKTNSDDRFQITLKRYEVSRLIFEDWDAAIGLIAESKDNNIIIKPSKRKDCFIIKSNESAYFVENENINLILDEMIAETVSQDILTDPQLHYVRDTWSDYTNI